MRRQCHGQRKSLYVQLNLRPVRRTELYTKVCTEQYGPYTEQDGITGGFH